jgi:hypothetical protein
MAPAQGWHAQIEKSRLFLFRHQGPAARGELRESASAPRNHGVLGKPPDLTLGQRRLWNSKSLDSFRGTSVKIGTIQRSLAWPLRKDDTLKSRRVDYFCSGTKARPLVGSSENLRLPHGTTEFLESLRTSLWASVVCEIRNLWIPFGEHPLKLERYREA